MNQQLKNLFTEFLGRQTILGRYLVLERHAVLQNSSSTVALNVEDSNYCDFCPAIHLLWREE